MAFDNDVAKFLPAALVHEEDENFCQAMRDVASGRKTVDEAWAWLEEQRRLQEGIRSRKDGWG